MPTLSKEFRRQLESAVLKAREEAERGAAAALESFGVADAKLPGHLDEAGRNLRRKLRAHGRQVGDLRRPDDSQEVTHLIHECAYEHWHRMLFARFLAENGFLIEPESGLDVDFAHCEEEGRRLGIDPWEVAARFAQRMLPGIFRADDPVLQLRLPAETRNALTALLASLPREVFLANDSLGWVYQFWQAKKKQDVNDSGVKIGADQLPAVTQLFTEDYMVDFLLDNTLGAWHAGKVLAANPKLAESAKNEDELRNAVALPGCSWTYLRFVKAEDGKWTPAAGTFAGWPKTAQALKVLDPCCGSGHFIVAMFKRLVALRVAEEKLNAKDAVTAVIRENIFGLELDPRCTQIGAFSLALAAWKMGGYQKDLQLNIACSGLGLNTKKDDWVKLAEGNPNLRFAMGALYDLFQKAPAVGSLISPRRDKSVTYSTTLQELQPLLKQALQREETDEGHELAVTAQGVAKAAEILAGQFTLVATNVPYLGRGKQDDVLKEYCAEKHDDAKGDLATCFIERCLDFASPDGTVSLVTPQAWLYLDKFKNLRERLLAITSWDFIIILGEHGFQSAQAAGAFVAFAGLTRSKPDAKTSFLGLDVSKLKSPEEKAATFLTADIQHVEQLVQGDNPDSRISFGETTSGDLLGNIALGLHGQGSFDDPCFVFSFWERHALGDGWVFQQTTGTEQTHYSGLTNIFRWEDGQGLLARLMEAKAKEGYTTGKWRAGLQAWGKPGIAVGGMRRFFINTYSGQSFDTNVAVILPHDSSLVPALWHFIISDEFHDAVRALDRNLKVSCNTYVKVQFDEQRWRDVAKNAGPLPKPFSSNPTQWLFNGHPKGSDHPLQVAVGRLVGYRWPRQTGSSFIDCPALEPDGLEKHADNDGVVCFSQARDEAPAVDRLRALLADAYGKDWSHAMERKLIANTGSKAQSLEEWLVNDFFEQHCELFQNRPFIWHIWDGRKDGFNALVHYHRLAGPKGEGHRTLETLTYAYLGDWIARQKDAVAHKEAGADDRLDAALELQGELKKIVAGEPPYDLFVRWKPLHRQPIGWEADINDGVRLNIRPFLVASLSRGKKGSGIIRAKPGSDVKWDRDRGNEPKRPIADFPWFWSWDEQTQDFAGNGEFDGNRWNDCHYTTAFKRAAREKKKS